MENKRSKICLKTIEYICRICIVSNNVSRNLVKNGPRARRGKAVQRAPSRLYRTVGVPTRSFNKAQCVGPEFVVRANQPSKTLCVGQVKVVKIFPLYTFPRITISQYIYKLETISGIFRL